VRAGEGTGAGAGQGRGARAALAAGRCEGLGAVQPAAPSPGVPGGAENRGRARRPRAAGGAAPPPPVSHRGLRRAGCGSLRTGSGAASPARVLLRAHLPVPSGRRGHGSPAQSCRCTATANCARAAASLSPMLLSLLRGRSWVPKFGETRWRDARWVWSSGWCRGALLPPLGTHSVQSRRALRLLCNLGRVSVEATYGFGSGISHTTAKKPGEQSSMVLRWWLPLIWQSWLKSVRSPYFKSISLAICISSCLDVSRTSLNGKVFLLRLRIYKTIKFIMLFPSWPRGTLFELVALVSIWGDNLVKYTINYDIARGHKSTFIWKILVSEEVQGIKVWYLPSLCWAFFLLVRGPIRHPICWDVFRMRSIVRCSFRALLKGLAVK
jgi:hypothetical protein